MISIETLHNHTPEEVFTFVANALIEQKVPSTSQYNWRECMYRTVGECGKILKCAAGHLIPDHLYNMNLEGRNFLNIHTTLPVSDEISAKNLITFQKASEYADGLIAKLQRCHDSAVGEQDYLENLVVKLNRLADERGYKRVELKSQFT
jgi:hypothetical protein